VICNILNNNPKAGGICCKPENIIIIILYIGIINYKLENEF